MIHANNFNLPKIVNFVRYRVSPDFDRFIVGWLKCGYGDQEGQKADEIRSSQNSDLVQSNEVLILDDSFVVISNTVVLD